MDLGPRPSHSRPMPKAGPDTNGKNNRGLRPRMFKRLRLPNKTEPLRRGYLTPLID